MNIYIMDFTTENGNESTTTVVAEDSNEAKKRLKSDLTPFPVESIEQVEKLED